MKFSAFLAKQQFLYFISFLLPVWTSDSNWAKMQISPDVLCSMPYGDFRLKVYEHIRNPTTLIGQKRYFYTPIALVDHKSAESKYSNVTKLSQVRFRIEIWNDHVQSEIVNYLSDFIGQQVRPNQIQVIPFEKMILTTTNPLSTVYSLSTNWLPYQLEQSLWFSLTCFVKEDCKQLKDIMHRDPTEFDHLKLLFSLSSQTSQIKEIIISMGHVVSSQMVSKLLKQCKTTKSVLITPEEEKRVLSEIKTNIIIESLDDSEVISPSSETQIYNALKDLLLRHEVRQNNKRGESVCWEDSDVSRKIDDDTEKEEDWNEFNKNTGGGENIEVDFSELNLPTDIPVDEISFSVSNSNTAGGDGVTDTKFDANKSILLSRLNLEKLRNIQLVDSLRMKVRFSTAVHSTFVHFVQFAKLSTIDEWTKLKEELQELNSDYQNLKTEHQNLKINHQNLKKNHEISLQATNMTLSALDLAYKNLSAEHKNLKMDCSIQTTNIQTRLLTELRKYEGFATPDISFHANRSNLFDKTSHYVSFEKVKLNRGNGFNNATGIFTAPKAGTYLFTFHARMNPRESQDVEIRLNGLEQTNIKNTANNIYGSSDYRTSAMSIVLPLNVNDQVAIYLFEGKLPGRAYFSGILIREKK